MTAEDFKDQLKAERELATQKWRENLRTGIKSKPKRTPKEIEDMLVNALLNRKTQGEEKA